MEQPSPSTNSSKADGRNISKLGILGGGAAGAVGGSILGPAGILGGALLGAVIGDEYERRIVLATESPDLDQLSENLPDSDETMDSGETPDSNEIPDTDMIKGALNLEGLPKSLDEIDRIPELTESTLENKSKEELIKICSNFRDRRNELNQIASEWASIRDALNAKTREKVDIAQGHREKRDELTENVQEHKEKRDNLNVMANELFDRIDQLKSDLGLSEAKDLEDLEEEVEQSESEQEIENLKDYVEEAKNVQSEVGHHDQRVTEIAAEAQKHHDLMIEAYNEADDARDLADKAHERFVEAQEVADRCHEDFIRIQKRLRELNKKGEEGGKYHKGAERNYGGRRMDRNGGDVYERYRDETATGYNEIRTLIESEQRRNEWTDENDEREEEEI